MSELYKARTSQMPAPASYAEETFRALLSKFESLGDNCEFGMVKRQATDEESGLLRWAFSPDFSGLVEAFRERFNGVFERSNLRPWTNDMVLDRRYAIAFHSNMISQVKDGVREFVLPEAENEAVYARDRTTIDKLRSRLLARLETGDTVFIYKRNTVSRQGELEPVAPTKSNAPVARETSELLACLKAYHPSNKLLVLSTETGKTPGSVWEVETDHYYGALDHNAPYAAASMASYDRWYEVILRMSEIAGFLPDRLGTGAALKQTSVAWSRPSAHNAASKTRWWFHPAVLRHRNRLMSGNETNSVIVGDIDFLRARQPQGFERAVSVGCGSAFKELSILRSGLVSHFTLYELAEPRIEQAIELAKKWGLSDKITVRREVQAFDRPGEFDLIHWNSSLHHMLDTAKAVVWSRASIRPGGAFYMNDCIAPDRLQYDPAYLAAASKFRRCLPDRLLAGPGGLSPHEVRNTNPEALAKADPSECADSSAILPALKRTFSALEVVQLGGVIYSCALNGIIANFGEDDEPLLKVALELDEQYAAQGMSEYAVAFARI